MTILVDRNRRGGKRIWHLFQAFVYLILTSNGVIASDWIYTFRPGDNLWDLTERHLISINYVPRLQQLNEIVNPYRIPPGTEIRIPLAWTTINPTDAEVVRVHGEVALTRGSSTVATPLQRGMRLAAGDEIYASEGAFSTLEFRDGSKLRVHPNSKIRIRNMDMYGDHGFFDSQIDLDGGRTENVVPRRDGGDSRLQIKTPAAVSSVRGTEFRVGVHNADQSSSTEVLSGAVLVRGAGSSVDIPAGFATRVAPGEPPTQPVPLLAAPDLSSLVTRYQVMPMEVVFGAITGATKYRVQISRDKAFEQLFVDLTAADSPISIPQLADGQYFVRVRAIDMRGIQGLDSSRDITVNARPEAPFPISPAAGTVILKESVVFKWAIQPSADEYLLHVSSDPKFEGSHLVEARIADAQYELKRSLDPGRYYWRLQSIAHSEGRGPFGAPIMFEIPQIRAADGCAGEIRIRN